MSTLITSLSLGSLYSLITLSFLFHFSIYRYLNFALLGYILITPYLLSELAKNQASIFIYILSIITVYFLLFVLSYVTSTFLIENLKNVSSEIKVIGSVSIFSIFFVLVSIFWPNDVLYETPFDDKSFSIFGSSLAYVDIFSICITIFLLLSFGHFFKKTYTGITVRAYSEDPITASSYGISTFKVRLIVHFGTALLCTIAGALLSAPGSPRAGVKSLIFFSLIAIAAVICARHVNYKVGVISAFLIAMIQIFVLRYLDSVNELVNKIISLGPLNGHIDLGPNFADRFLPYFIALLCLSFLPSKLFKQVDRK
jgi:branched-chain amino acid transport system permease protein